MHSPECGLRVRFSTCTRIPGECGYGRFGMLFFVPLLCQNQPDAAKTSENPSRLNSNAKAVRRGTQGCVRRQDANLLHARRRHRAFEVKKVNADLAKQAVILKIAGMLDKPEGPLMHVPGKKRELTLHHQGHDKRLVSRRTQDGLTTIGVLAERAGVARAGRLVSVRGFLSLIGEPWFINRPFRGSAAINHIHSRTILQFVIASTFSRMDATVNRVPLLDAVADDAAIAQ